MKIVLTTLAALGLAPVIHAAPLTIHPRLWFTSADLPRLRSWVVPSNPMWQSFNSALTQAVSNYHSKFFPGGVPASPFPQPSPPAAAIASGYLTITFPRSLAAPDVTLLVEAAPAPAGAWQPGSRYSLTSGDTPVTPQTTETARTAAGSFQTITVRDNTAITAAHRRFLRLRALLP